MSYEIVKTESGKFALYVQGEFVSEYTRKSSAERGYLRFVASMQAEVIEGGGCADTQADSACAAGCGAVQPPPTSNTGGLKSTDLVLYTDVVKERGNPDSETKISERVSEFVMVNGKVKEIPLRVGVATSAHIDTFSLVLTHDVFIDDEKRRLDFENNLTDIVKLANSISQTMKTLFGFGIVEQKNGLNGYKYSFRMGTDNATYGMVAFGGANQGDTILIHLYGEGLTAAKDGWERSLYNFLKLFAPFAHFTRVDLAHDFKNGEYTPNKALNHWDSGGFTQKNTRPNSQCYGADWNNERFPDGSVRERTGKTFYVGSKNSSRYLRVYEKGVELGDKTSNWVRFELQLRNKDYVIPHEILLGAGEYLTGAYPICQELFKEHVEDMRKCERVKKSEEISMLHVLRYAVQAASPCVNMLEQFGFDDSEIKLLLQGGKFKLPKRLISGDKVDYLQANVTYIHEVKEVVSTRFSSEIRNYFTNLNEKHLRKKRTERLEKQAKLHEITQMSYSSHWTDCY